MTPVNSNSCSSLLLGISRGLAQRTSIQKTLEEICTHVEAYFSPKHLAFLIAEPETGDLTFIHVNGDKADLVAGKKLRKGKGVAGWVAETGEPLLIENASTDARFLTQFQTAKTQGATSIMAVPLKSGDLVYGVLEVFDNQQGVLFTKDNLMDLMAVADITAVAVERAYYFQAMKRMAETDQLTGLPNKRSFDRYLEREIEVCKRYGNASSVLLMTLNNLRALNEEHGLTVADQVIQVLGGILMEDVRKVDTPCRIGSNKFAVIMPCTSQMHALEVCNRINAKIQQQSSARQLPYFTVSLDVRSGNHDDITPLLGISEASKAGTQGFRKFRNVAANLYQMLNEEKQAMERRQYYRKTVQLAGHYITTSGEGVAGDILVENLSLNGVGFTTLLSSPLKKNDLIRLSFRLDDSRRTEIVRIMRVRYCKDRYVGCQFADQKSYDSDLGFYLMR